MSALEPPSEIVLVAIFDAAAPAETAARALLHSGLDVGRVALFARGDRGTAFTAVPRSSTLQVPGLGRLVARGAAAVELEAERELTDGLDRLGVAVRRLGLSVTDIPRLEQALRTDRVVVLGIVPRLEASRWGRVLRDAGAVFLGARPRLVRWPPHVHHTHA